MLTAKLGAGISKHLVHEQVQPPPCFTVPGVHIPDPGTPIGFRGKVRYLRQLFPRQTNHLYVFPYSGLHVT